MTKTGGPKPWYRRDIWLILIIIVVTGVTLWNSRAVLFPDRFVEMTDYSRFGVTFRHPLEVDLWEIGLDSENIFDYTGAIQANEEGGMVGYGFDGNEVSVTWAAFEQTPGLEEVLETHYRSLTLNAERRDRGVTITRGELESGEVNGHTMALQFHEVELIMPDSSEPLYGEGYVGGWVCPDNGRFYLLYAYSWRLGQPPDLTKAQALDQFNAFLRTLSCH